MLATKTDFQKRENASNYLQYILRRIKKECDFTVAPVIDIQEITFCLNAHIFEGGSVKPLMTKFNYEEGLQDQLTKFFDIREVDQKCAECDLTVQKQNNLLGIQNGVFMVEYELFDDENNIIGKQTEIPLTLDFSEFVTDPKIKKTNFSLFAVIYCLDGTHLDNMIYSAIVKKKNIWTEFCKEDD